MVEVLYCRKQDIEAVARCRGGGLSGFGEGGRGHQAASVRSAIHSEISDSSQATAFVEMRRLRGKSPRRSMRHLVTRDKPVIRLTSGSRTKRSVIGCTPIVFGEHSPEDKECRSAECGFVRKCGMCGSFWGRALDGILRPTNVGLQGL